MRILIADDKAATRAGIREALTDHGFTTVAEATDAAGTVENAREKRPDVCLISIEIPGGGIWAAREIAQRLPGTAVIMLTVSSDEAHFLDALRAGAIGYLLMDTDPARLPHALRGALGGEAALPRRLITRLIDEFRSQGRRRRLPVAEGTAAEVTNREWEVLDLMRDGLTTAEVAARLFVSPVTVRRHVSAAVKKLGVADRESALRLLEEASAGRR